MESERAALAAVLVGGPRVLLLDEPTRGMDAVRKRALAMMLHRLRDDGVAILLATHDVELVAEVPPASSCSGTVASSPTADPAPCLLAP